MATHAGNECAEDGYLCGLGPYSFSGGIVKLRPLKNTQFSLFVGEFSAQLRKSLCLLWLSGECGFFGDALGLFEVTLFVDHDDAIGVHETVSDRSRDR